MSCWVVGADPEGGRAAEAVIYQGNTQRGSPTLYAAFPDAGDRGTADVLTSVR